MLCSLFSFHIWLLVLYLNFTKFFLLFLWSVSLYGLCWLLHIICNIVRGIAHCTMHITSQNCTSIFPNNFLLFSVLRFIYRQVEFSYMRNIWNFHETIYPPFLTWVDRLEGKKVGELIIIKNNNYNNSFYKGASCNRLTRQKQCCGSGMIYSGSRQNFRIHADPDPHHWKYILYIFVDCMWILTLWRVGGYEAH